MPSTSTVIAPYHSVNLGGNSYTNITTATTTVIKSVSGVLHSLSLNTLVGGDVITIYDNSSASGTKIATITVPATVTTIPPFTVTLDIGFGVGLTIVTSAATDVTVSWR